jgi:hypothetical protein
MAQEIRDVGDPTGITVSGMLSQPAPRRVTREPRRDVTLKSINLIGEDRQRLIAEAAYLRAEQRGFAPGQELEDWLAAEIEIDALLGDDEPI